MQLRPGLPIEAYNQFEWRQNRVPGVGSYFSTTDILDAGGERMIVAPGQYLLRNPDKDPSTLGQFGATIKATLGDTDFGLYALNYNARSPTVTQAACLLTYTVAGQVGTYQLVHPRGIRVVGASASTFLGNDNVAGEISLRQGAPLLARQFLGASPLPRGNTAHGQVSVVLQRPANALWDRATLMAELAGNTLIGTSAGAAGRDPATTRAAVAVQGQLTLDYLHVLPALDLSPFVAAAYGIAGTSSVDTEMVAGAGNVTFGVQATYRDVWHADIRATDDIGSAGRQPLADRSFFSFNVRRAF